MPKIKVKGQTVQTGQRPQTNGRKMWQQNTMFINRVAGIEIIRLVASVCVRECVSVRLSVHVGTV